MTLALAGKTQRRKTFLVLAAFISIIISMAGGASLYKADSAQACGGSCDPTRIIVKKVTVGDPAATSFSADIDNESPGDEGSINNVSFSVASPYTRTITFQWGDDGNDDFNVIEDTPPANWALTGKKVLSGNATCPAADGPWDAADNTDAGRRVDFNLTEHNTKTVCFRNVYTPQVNIQIHKYLPIDNVNNPWQNQGVGQGDWLYTIYADNAGVPGAVIASGIGHLNPSPLFAKQTVWLKETDTDGDTFFGWFVPDGDNNSGNDHCNQAPADFTTGVPDARYSRAEYLKINASFFDTTGNATGLFHICAYDQPVTGKVIVHKVGIDIPAGTGDAVGTVSPAIDSQMSWSAAMSGGSDTFDPAPNDTYTVVETGMPKVVTGGEIRLFGYKEATSTTECSTAPGEYTDDGVVTVNGDTRVVCVMNKFVPTQVITQDVTFIKAVCPTFGVIPANLPVAGLGYGTNDMPAGKTVADLAAAAPAEGVAVGLGNIPGACTREAGWSFNLPGRVVTTVADGGDGLPGVKVTLNEAELTEALKPWNPSPGVYQGLSVSEVKQAGYGFGQLKCYKDHHLLDNSELINIPAAGTSDVYCIAYNVPDTGTLIIKKVNTGGPATDGFTADIAGGTQNIGFSQAAPSAAQVLSAGLYTVSEDLKAGYQYKGFTTSTDGTCPGSPAGDTPNNVTITAGQTTTICFYNEALGTVIVRKIVTGDASSVADQFGGTVSGPTNQTFSDLSANNDKVYNSQVAGDYTVAETNVNGYTLLGYSFGYSGDGVGCPDEPTPSTSGSEAQALSPGGTVVFCIHNRKDAQVITGAVYVQKVVAGAPISAGETFGGTLTGKADWALANGGIAVYSGIVIPEAGVSFTANETSMPAHYVNLGYSVVPGNDACPASAAGPASTATLTQANTLAKICVYNEAPRGSIEVTKTTVTSHNGGADQPVPQDRDGWKITLKSVACGVDTFELTDAAGKVTFPNLLLCSDYVVAEDLSAPGAADYVPVGASFASGITPANPATQVAFMNRRSTFEPPCIGCVPFIFETPVPPTATPVPPTATPVPPKTDAVLGEKTPGALATPIAPVTGTGAATTSDSFNGLFILVGIAILGTGFALANASRRNNRN